MLGASRPPRALSVTSCYAERLADGFFTFTVQLRARGTRCAPPLGLHKREGPHQLTLGQLCPLLQTLKYWDLRTPNPVATVQLPERCYGASLSPVALQLPSASLTRSLRVALAALDVCYPLMVVGTAERHIQIFNLTQPTQAFKTLTSPLRWQTRTVRLALSPSLSDSSFSISWLTLGALDLSCRLRASRTRRAMRSGRSRGEWLSSASSCSPRERCLAGRRAPSLTRSSPPRTQARRRQGFGLQLHVQGASLHASLLQTSLVLPG